MRTFITVLVLGFQACATAAPVRLASGGRALLPIVIGEKASDSTKATAAELVGYLTRIGGAKFVVETGDGSGGMVLGAAGDFGKLPFAVKFGAGPFEREDYLLRSAPDGMWLIGASDLGVAHASWDLLHRLGYRQFFPGETWEVVPEIRELAIEVEARESPSFHARRIWYNWGMWGYNDTPYQQWCVRNRAVQGFKLNSGHAYEAIIAQHHAEFETHPEYLAQVGGKRELRGDAKFCVSNVGLRKLVTDWAVAQFKMNPQQDSISMDPSDGGGWCECEACAKIGSVSDRVVTLANEVATAINLGIGTKYVGHYAYNQHSEPPHLRVDPHVIPSATTAFINGGFTFDQVLSGWQKQGATMGVYDYLSVVDWDWNLPRGGAASRPKRVAELLAHIHTLGVRFYDAESGDCWGPCGLGYYVASRVLWDVRQAGHVESLVADFLEKAFGTARAPMGEFYALITEDAQRRSPSDIVGRMYRHLAAARAATADVRVLRRIDDLTLYTRYAELMYAHQNGGPKEDVARHAYRMRETMMVHAYGLWSRMLSQKDAATPGHPLKNEVPFSADELTSILAAGIAQNQPVEPGFVGVEFSKELVPAAPRLTLAKVSAGSFPSESQDRQRYYLWAPPSGSIDLRIVVNKRWANRKPMLKLFSPLEVTLAPVAVREDYLADNEERALTLKTPYPGLHRIETYDGGDYTHLTWPAGLPVTVESSLDTPDVTSQFRGPWNLYFYVPKGTKLVGGWASRVANWAPKVSGKLLAPDGSEMLDFDKLEDGFFKVEVPPGTDGALWKFAQTHGQRLLLTVPPYFARSGEELLLPREVVEADAAR